MRPATISNLRDSTSEDAATGAVRSVQAADLSLPREALRELWSATYLERLARTYWRFLTRVTLGLVRVRYSADERALVLAIPILKLIVFAAPEYELEQGHGIVRWRITRGLLVARRGHERGGYLQIEVRRLPGEPGDLRLPSEPDEDARLSSQPAVDQSESAEIARLHVEVAVEGFYPAIASRLGRRFYRATQSRVHVLITHAFLRSLARLDLAESRVGRFAG